MAPPCKSLSQSSGVGASGNLRARIARITPGKSGYRTFDVLGLHFSGYRVNQDLGDYFRFADDSSRITNERQGYADNGVIEFPRIMTELHVARCDLQRPTCQTPFTPDG